MFRRLRIGIATALAVAFAITSGVSAQTSGNVITIGYTGPLSGGAAQYGADVQRGIQMAIDEINASGGVMVGGKKSTFKLSSLDDQYRPPAAQTNAQRLAQDGATVIFCPHAGGIAALMSINQNAPKFIVGAYSSDPAILQQKNPLILMIPPSYASYFKPYAEVEMKRFGKKLGLIPTTTAYGNGWTKGFSETWTSMGGTVQTNNGVDYNTTADFSSVVSKALAEKPDVLFVGGPSQPTALVMKAARDQGFTGGFVTMDQAKFDQMDTVLSMARLEGSVGLLPFREGPGPGLKSFIDEYTKKFGKDREPNPEMGNNYMAMHIFARAMGLAGSTDPAAVEAKLDAAARALPKNQQPIAIKGVLKTGHIEEDIYSAVVEKGTFKSIHVPASE
jgi:branched-chain amino acid transport system substrate-binding protein